MKLSIIIPVYNVEMYVQKCIVSCLNQNIPYSDYEIIIVNDGSNDNSLSVIESVVNSYSNIVLISQENQGLSRARNTGLYCAKGDYIWFVDSDDWIEENCLLQIFEYLHDIDLISLAYNKIDDQKILFTKRNFSRNIITGIDLIRTNDFLKPVQFYIYNKNFLLNNGLYFYPHIYHEDVDFTSRALFFAKKIKFKETPVYYHYVRSGSITSSHSLKRSLDLLIIANNLFLFQENIAYSHKSEYANIVSSVINNSLYNIQFLSDKDILSFRKELINNRHLIKFMTNSSITKYKLQAIAFYLFPSYCFHIYRFLKKCNFYV